MQRLLSVVFFLIPLSAMAAAVEAVSSPEDFTSLARAIHVAIRDGHWATVAALALVVVVGAIRTYGRKVMELLPDWNKLHKVLSFFFETKPGGWLLNVLTTLAGSLTTSIFSGEPITVKMFVAAIQVALSGAAVWGAVKDLAEWRESRKPPRPEV